MYFHRAISSKIESLSRQFPALILTGARQTGKTTLLRKLFPKHTYISLDLPSLAELAQRDPATFFAQHPEPVIIDEAQYAPQLFRQLKVLIDQDRARKGRFILTGSQKFLLMESISESLAGRIGIAELDTLSSQEILAGAPNTLANASHNDVVRLLVRGTFPELWEDPSLNTTEFYRAYLATYLERDVRLLSRIGSLSDFERFLRLCATRSGQLVNKSELGKQVGISNPTANEWLSILQASNQITLLEPYFHNHGKRLVKTPKLYLHDTGLLCFLLGLSEHAFAQPGPLIGPIWETFVFNQLRRAIMFSSTAASLWFWRDQYKHEVDFLLSNDGRAALIEAKFSETPAPRELANVAQVRDACGIPTAKGYIASPIGNNRPSDNDIRIVNAITTDNWLAL